MRIERVEPLTADVRDILGAALPRHVDEDRFEHGELRIGLRVVTDLRQRVDMAATDRALLPRDGRRRHVRGLPRDLHAPVRITRRGPHVRDEPTRRGTRTISGPFDRVVELGQPPRELRLEPRHLPPQPDQIITLRLAHNVGLREVINDCSQPLDIGGRHAATLHEHMFVYNRKTQQN